MCASPLLLCSQEKIPPARSEQTRVLVLNSYHPGYNWSDGEQAALLQTLGQSRPNLLPWIEYLDWRRFPSPERAATFLTQLEQKYGRQAFDLIVALDDPAVDFALQHRDFFGAKVPVVFGGVNDFEPDYFRTQHDVTGVIQNHDFLGTLNLIHRLQPGVTKIAAVHCQTESGLASRRSLERLLAQSPQPFTFDWVEGWTAESLLQRLGALPDNTAVLIVSIYRNEAGRVLADDENFGRALAARSRVPVYFVAPPMVRHFGRNTWEDAVWQGLGGSLLAADLHGELVARLALRILGGEPAGAIPIITESPARLAVDYTQLERFGLSPGTLPAGTQIYHAPPSFYQVHRSRIVAGIVLIVVLGATVVLLVAFIMLRRRGERALRRSHEHFQLIARATNDAVWDWDLAHDTLWWNEGYTRQLQLSREVAQDFKTWESHLHAEDRAGIVQALRGMHDNQREQWSVEYRVVRSDGEVRHVLDRIVVERHASGRPLRLLGARLDLTDRKKAEQELRRLATAVHQCAEAIIILNPDGVISYVNPAFERITGFPPPETLQLIYSLLRNPRTKPLAFAQVKERVRTTGQWAIRLEGHKRDGADCVLQAVVSPICDREEKIVNYVLVGQDVTRESKLEDQIRLSQKMEAVGQLAGGIAHDFNNLLQVIRSCASQAMAAPGETERQECLQQVSDTAAKAAQLTRQLLVFSRNEPTQFVPLNLNELLAQQLGLLRRLLGARIEIDFRPAETWDLIHGDGGQLEQVFMNLCINARDAMPQGGRITLEVSKSQLNDSFCSAHPWARPGQYMQVVATDNGSGMDRATLARIFDPFFTTKAKDQGTGLGLAIVYGIVQKHEGLLHVYSEPGVGTSFRVYLPAQDLKAPSKSPFVSTNSARPTGRTILLADDEAMVRTLAVRILERAGHRVIAASDGAEALAAFSAHAAEIHLVILDAIMPEMDGPEVFRQIRALAPDLPVLFCSGYSQGTFPEAFVPDDAVRMLAKPYDPAELLAMVNTLLSQPGSDRRE